MAVEEGGDQAKPNGSYLAEPVEFVVHPFEGHEFFVGALLPDPAVVHHKDPIGPSDRGKPVSDDQSRPLPGHGENRFLDQTLCLRIDARCGLVKNQHFRVIGQGSCKGEKLAFSCGKVRPLLSDLLIHTFRQFLNE